MVDILPLGSGSVDPHIFADPDPDPGSQNLADPTDPDPKHWIKHKLYSSWENFVEFLWRTKSGNLNKISHKLDPSDPDSQTGEQTYFVIRFFLTLDTFYILIIRVTVKGGGLFLKIYTPVSHAFLTRNRF